MPPGGPHAQSAVRTVIYCKRPAELAVCLLLIGLVFVWWCLIRADDAARGEAEKL